MFLFFNKVQVFFFFFISWWKHTLLLGFFFMQCIKLHKEFFVCSCPANWNKSHLFICIFLHQKFSYWFIQSMKFVSIYTIISSRTHLECFSKTSSRKIQICLPSYSYFKYSQMRESKESKDIFKDDTRLFFFRKNSLHKRK